MELEPLPNRALVITAGSYLKPVLMMEFHRRFVNLAVMTPPNTSDSNPTQLQTGGEGGFGPSGDGVVLVMYSHIAYHKAASIFSLNKS
jgi:hypothetical protein